MCETVSSIPLFVFQQLLHWCCVAESTFHDEDTSAVRGKKKACFAEKNIRFSLSSNNVLLLAT